MCGSSGKRVIPMTDAMKYRLLDLKARQDAGEHMACPRCGRDTMYYPVRRNALSRAANLLICSDCGLQEALAAFTGRASPVEDWAAMKNT